MTRGGSVQSIRDWATFFIAGPCLLSDDLLAGTQGGASEHGDFARPRVLMDYSMSSIPMSYFCIYPHSGIPQWLKGLILAKNPLREPWFKILPSGGGPILPSLGHVTPTAIVQFPPCGKNNSTPYVFFLQDPPLALARFKEGLLQIRQQQAEHPRYRLRSLSISYPFYGPRPTKEEG
jgi:hypothetical protein